MDCFCGHAKEIITPEFKVSLAGYAHRVGKFESVKNDLYVRTIFFKSENAICKLIISADLIWWDDTITDDLKTIINKEYLIRKSNILFAATHTHCSPQTSFRFTPSLGIPDKNYIDYLKKQTLKAVKQAVNKNEKCKFYKKSTSCDIGINRRLIKNNAIEMAPNPNGINDTAISLLEIKDFDNNLIGLIVHGLCHANVSAENSISPDFPGIAMHNLENRYKGMTAVYLQGFCGDIRPNIISDTNEFIRSDNKKAVEIATKLSDRILFALENESELITSKYNIEEGCTINFNPDYRYYPNKNELRKIIENEKNKVVPSQLLEWSETVLQKRYFNKKNLADINLQYLPITDDFKLIAINAEVVADYHFWLKTEYGNSIIPVAYSNGMIGYLATEEQQKEGGYEANKMYQYFALPSPFNENLERKLKYYFDLLWRKNEKNIN